MKKLIIAGIVVALGTVMGLALGCANTRIKKVSGEEFLKHAEQTDELNSYVWTSYIGSSHDRVYLEYGHPALIGKGAQVTVLWTPLAELPSNVIIKIKNNIRPWTNAMDQIVQQPAGSDGTPALQP